MRSHVLTAALVLAAPLVCQTRFPLDRYTPGILGQSLAFGYQAAIPGLIYLLVDFSPGPIPPVLLPGISSIPLDVSLNAFPIPSFTSSPSGLFLLPMPAVPAFAGVTLFAQAATLNTTGIGNLLAQVSYGVTVQVGFRLSDPVTPGSPEAMVGPRQQGSTSSPSTGRVLGVLIRDQIPADRPTWIYAAGAVQVVASQWVGLTSSDRFDPRTLSFTPGPTLTTGRFSPAAVELADGRTLVLGGIDPGGVAIAACEIYDPATDTFSPTGAMLQSRLAMAAGLLPNGEVIVVGGTGDARSPLQALLAVRSSTEVYNPTTGLWRLGPGSFPLVAPNLTRMIAGPASGSLLLSGGLQVTLIPIPAVVTSTASWLLATATGPWTATGALQFARALHESVALPTGDVIVLGGVNATTVSNAQTVGLVDLYQAATGTWTTLASMPLGVAATTPVFDPITYSIHVVGGVHGAYIPPNITATPTTAIIQSYDIANNAWSQWNPLLTTRGCHATVRTEPDGLLVPFSGLMNNGGNVPLATAETIRL